MAHALCRDGTKTLRMPVQATKFLAGAALVAAMNLDAYALSIAADNAAAPFVIAQALQAAATVAIIAIHMRRIRVLAAGKVVEATLARRARVLAAAAAVMRVVDRAAAAVRVVVAAGDGDERAEGTRMVAVLADLIHEENSSLLVSEIVAVIATLIDAVVSVAYIVVADGIVMGRMIKGPPTTAAATSTDSAVLSMTATARPAKPAPTDVAMHLLSSPTQFAAAATSPVPAAHVAPPRPTSAWSTLGGTARVRVLYSLMTVTIFTAKAIHQVVTLAGVTPARIAPLASPAAAAAWGLVLVALMELRDPSIKNASAFVGAPAVAPPPTLQPRATRRAV
ncbi:hypothetical protein AMAG_05326 [Allomyces macrogynus ATCC 38327]|uniref:Uncharacterized protein n=1 Tax=Allomyces macrogynus (strain ATCC 38327) TaxID=578462 RepID=A0A0L0SBS8_ALLM3|nr:hypothetical protein AMAG_05326 [Allomyces macrogynus ATCC 38327]|eukprot:KNE59874.1 hypothetical protein AMAG_05326 [Allomyces macrogynus ATCC 38327]